MPQEVSKDVLKVSDASGRILAMILGDVGRMMSVGLALGGVQSFASGLLAAAGAGAALLPARRAARIDPLDSRREG